jgi:DNA-binding CsgD family transcriptional regulator
MDALGIYALSCAAYSAIILFRSAKGKRLCPRSRRLLFALCFLPVVVYSAMVLADRGLGHIDLLKGLDAFLCWIAIAATALPCVLRARDEGATDNHRLLRLTAISAIASCCLLVLVSLAKLFFGLPGIAAAALYALTLIAFSALAFIPRPLLPGVAQRAAAGRPAISAKDCEAWGISDREREVLDLLIEGKTNREIADALFISLSTVKTHIASVFAKTGARNRVEAARIFGLGPPPKG